MDRHKGKSQDTTAMPEIKVVGVKGLSLVSVFCYLAGFLLVGISFKANVGMLTNHHANDYTGRTNTKA